MAEPVEVAIAWGVNDLGETEWLLPNGTTTATACDYCDQPYVPLNKSQRCCAAPECQKKRSARPPRPKAKCEQCGAEFEQKASTHKTCSKRCQNRSAYLKKRQNPDYVKARRERFDAWYEKKKAGEIVPVSPAKKPERWGPPLPRGALKGAG